MDDGGDYKKARGVLLTYSTFLLAMWFFQAKLTQFNLLGVSLTLEHHKESIWLVLAVLNIYFWFRFFQRLPRLGLYFDEPMHDLYDDALVWLTVVFKRRTLKRLAEQRFSPLREQGEQMKLLGYGGNATARSSLAEDQENHGDEAPELHQISREARTKIKLWAGYQCTDEGKWLSYSSYARLDYQPNVVMTWAAKAFAIVKGAFVTPWFTDHVAPLVLGGISTTIALWKWWEMNFLTVAA
ncbi:hypothetical protein [Pseudomonas sp. ZB1P45]|uniref:hypothetical protein n=1 Tax=Pseudomonas frigoris TaxID=3398356 RepID=UPI0039EF5BC6